MAYPTVSAPYGFQPVNSIGGTPYAGSTRLVPIASTAGLTDAAMYNGDLVELTSGGTCQVVSDSTAVAYVVDDPRALFKVAMVSSGTTIAGLGRTAVGQNTSVVLNAGNANTGDSKQAIDDTTATTNTLPIRIVDVVPATATGADTFVEFIVKINTHTYNNTTGV